MHQRRRAPEPIRLGPFQLDLRARELRKDGQPVRLQDKPFELLVALIERPGEAVTRDDLRHRLWPSDTFVVFDDSLNTAIRKIRDALGDTADAPRYIQTVPRHGYRYIGPIEAPDDAVAASATESTEPIASTTPRSRRRVATISLGGAVLLAVALVLWFARGREPSAPSVVRFDIIAPSSTNFLSGWSRVAVSPDGRQVAFCAVRRPSAIPQVWLQSLDASSARPLRGTEGATEVVWSPDGRSIAFRSTGGVLKRYDPATSVAVPLADVGPEDEGLAWSAMSGIIFAGGQGRGLARVTPSGGVEPISTLDSAREETMHAWPQFLPDGRSFIYVAISRRQEWSGLYLARLGESTRHLLRAGPYMARFVAPGMLVYGNGSQLLAQQVDLNRATLFGTPVEVAADVRSNTTDGFVDFAVSAGGVLAHGRPSRMPVRELTWVNRAGQPVGGVGDAGRYNGFRLSPDSRWAVLEAVSAEEPHDAPDLWLVDLMKDVRSRVTSGPGNDEGGVWAPDSRRFAYARHPDIHRPAEICLKRVEDPEGDELLLSEGSASVHPFDWSRDGRFILYGLAKGGTQDIWVLPLDSGAARYEWLSTAADEREARFSPDGRWVAYQSDETGRPEVFVRSFNPPGLRRQISNGGGTAPEWSDDGQELYFVSGDFRLMAASVRSHGVFGADVPHALFEFRRLAPSPQWSTPYGVSAGKQRFLLGSVINEGADGPIGIVLNWARLVSQSH